MAQANIGSLVKGMRLLEILADSGRAMGVSELARLLEQDKSAIYRLLATLKSGGYVEQDPESKKYAIGPRTIVVSSRVLGNNDVYRYARPTMEKLLEETRETVHLGMLMGNEVVYIAQEVSPEVISVNTEIGQREAIHCTAVGKALVACLPDEEREAIIEQLDFQRYTPATITDPEQFRVHCRQVAIQGYAVDDEELYAGVRCVAAPVMGYNGNVLAALGISGPATRLSVEALPRLGEVILKHAREVSRRLGYLG